MKLNKLTQINLITQNNLPRPFVIGGQSISQSSLDYNLVSLEYKGEHRCTGTLFSQDYLITSAQCNFGDLQDWKLALLNTASSDKVDFEDKDDEALALELEENDPITHFNIINRQLPIDYNSTRLSFDFSIWKTENFNFKLKKKIKFHSKQIVFGKNLISIGINSKFTKFSEQTNIILLNQTHLPSKYCREQFYSKYNIVLNSRDHICFGDMVLKEQEVCQGNLGAPLFLLIDDKLILIGVNSYSKGCENLELPGIFSYVSKDDIDELLDDFTWR